MHMNVQYIYSSADNIASAGISVSADTGTNLDKGADTGTEIMSVSGHWRKCDV